MIQTRQLIIKCLIGFTLTLLGLVSAQAAELQTIKIGLAENFSVMSDATTNPYINHVRNAVDYVLQKNAAALKKKGVKIEIVQFDHQGDKIKVLEVAQKAAESDISAILGFYNSSEALLAAPVFNSRKILFVTPAASADRLDSMGPAVFRTGYSDQAQAKVLAQYARNSIKAQTANIVSISDCAYCQSLAESFKIQFTKSGGKVLVEYKLLSAQLLNKEQLKELKSKPSDIVFLPNYERVSATLLSQMHDAGLRPLYYMAGDGWGNTGELFYTITGGRDYKAIVTSHWHPDIQTTSSKKFADEFMKQYQREPIDTTALLADGMQFLVDVILKAKGFDRDDIIQSAQQPRHFNGVISKIDFKAGKTTPEKDIPLLQYVNKSVRLEKLVRPQ